MVHYIAVKYKKMLQCHQRIIQVHKLKTTKVQSSI